MKESPNGTVDKTTRAVIPGSRLFNTPFGLSRPGKEYHEIFRHVPKRLPSRPQGTQRAAISHQPLIEFYQLDHILDRLTSVQRAYI
jgi:hypothetical protein